MSRFYFIALFVLVVNSVNAQTCQPFSPPFCDAPPSLDFFNGPMQVAVGSVSYYSLPLVSLTNPMPNMNNFDLSKSEWEITGGGQIIEGNIGSAVGISWNTSGTYQVSVTPKSERCGEGLKRTQTVTVINQPIIPAPIITGPNDICVNQVATFSVPAIAGKTVSWSYGFLNNKFEVWPIVSISGANLNITWNAEECYWPQSFYIFAAYSDGTTTGSYALKNINKYTPEINGTNLETVCIGTNSTYFVPNLPLGASVNWSLSGGGTLTTSSNQANVNWNTQGAAYTLTASIVTSCATRSVSKIVRVGSPSIPEITGAATACLNTSGDYKIVAEQPGDNISWSLNGGGTLSSITGESTTVQWNTEGDPYLLSATVSNTCGTSAAGTKSISVGPGQFSAPGQITSSSSTFCKGSVANFSVAPVIGATEYEWTYHTLNNNSKVTYKTTSPTVSIPLVYWWNSSLKVKANNGYCYGSESAPFNFFVNNTYTGLPPDNQEQACVNSTRTYNISIEPNATYNWRVTGGTILNTYTTTSSGWTFSHVEVQWTTEGDHKVTLYAVSPCFAGEYIAYRTNVKVASATPPFIIGIEEICAPYQARYTITNVDLNFVPVWEVTGGSVVAYSPSKDMVTINWNGAAGNYILRVRNLYNACGGNMVAELPITLKTGAGSAPPSPIMAEPNAAISVCLNQTVEYPLSGYSPSYKWKVDNVAYPITSNSTTGVMWTTPGDHVVFGSSYNGICQGDVSTLNPTNFYKTKVGQEPIIGTLTASTTSVCKSGNVDLTLSEYTGTITWVKREKIGPNGPWSGYTFTSNTSGTQSYSINNVTSSDVYYEFIVAVSFNGCTRLGSDTARVVARAVPSSIMSTSNAVICKGGSTQVSVAMTGTAPWSLTYTDGSTSTTITDIVSSPYLINASPATSRLYKVTALQDAYCAATTLGSIYITVIDPGTIGGGSNTVCTGGNPVAFTNTQSATFGSGVSYQWQNSTDNIIFSDISGATLATFDPPVITETTHYRRNAIWTYNGNTCSTSSNVKTVIVNGVTGGVVGNDQTICSSGDPSAFVEITPSSGATLTYLWQSSPYSTTSFTNISGATGVVYDAPVSTQTKYYKRITTSTLNGVACSTTSNNNTALTVAINAVTSPGTIAGNQTICNGGDPVAFTSTAATVTGSGVISYQWRKSLDDIIYTDIDLATGATYDVLSGEVTQTTHYKRVAISTLNGVACSATTTKITVTVNPISGGVIGADQTICSNSDPAAFTQTPATGTGSYSYQWQSSSDGVTFPNNIATGPTYDAGALTQTTYYKREVTVTNGALSCKAISNIVTVTVKPLSTVTTLNKVICSGTSADLSLTSDVSGTEYSWTVITKSTAISGINLGQTGTTNLISNALTNSSSSSSFPVVFRVTPTANGCPGAYKDITITVNSRVTGGSVVGNQTICEGGDPTVFNQTGSAPVGYGTLSHQWQSTTDMPDVPFSDISGATSSSYNVPAGLMETMYYQRAIKSTQNGITCAAYSNPLTVNVSIIRAGSIAADQTICSGGNPVAFTETEVPTWNGSLTHQWKSSINGSTYANITGATSKVYDASVLSLTTYYKRFTTSVFNGATCTAESNPVVVTVSSPTAVITPATSTIFCDGQPISVVLNEDSNSGANLSYQWTKDGVNIERAIQSSFQATEVGGYQVKVTNDAFANCFTTSSAVSVSVQTTGTILEGGNLCAHGFVTLRTETGSGHVWSTGESTDQITVYDPGIYSVQYYTSNGCLVYAEKTVVRTGSACIYYRVKKEDEPKVEEVEETKTIGIYPNPANDEITVQISEQALYDLEVNLISQMGNEVGSSAIKKGENKTSFDARNLANGIYIVVVKSEHGFVMRQKVLVQHH